MKRVVQLAANHPRLRMVTASEAITELKPAGRISSPAFISWADRERDLSAWLGNEMQRDAFDTLVRIGSKVNASGDPFLADTWRYLQTSDHFYYMSTKKGDDGKVHHYFSPYSSPYEAFINYMNVLADIDHTLQGRNKVADRYRKRNKRVGGRPGNDVLN